MTKKLPQFLFALSCLLPAASWAQVWYDPIPTQVPMPAESNVALASTGAIAKASSTWALACPASVNRGCVSGFSPMYAIDGEHTGVNWTNGGGWADAWPDDFTNDWLQVDFNGTKEIDRVAVYTVQDDWQHPVEPSDTMTFSQYGVQDFKVQAWNGFVWVDLATVTGNNLVKRTVTFPATRTYRIRVLVTKALAQLSRITEVEAYGYAAPAMAGSSINVALDSRGATITASSTYGPGFEAANVIADSGGTNLPTGSIDPYGAIWGAGRGWADATVDSYPDWLEVHFNGQQTIDRVRVWTLPDNYGINPMEGLDPGAFTFAQYGIQDYTVLGWNGSDWLTLVDVKNNNLVGPMLTFPAFTTDRIRIVVTRALLGLSRITGVEAFTAMPLPDRVNFASATNGGSAAASSSAGPGYPVAAVIDNDENGINWTNGGGWAAAMSDGSPYVDITFSAVKTIDTVTVVTVQDNYANPWNVTDTMGFSQYGMTGFEVLTWNGTSWVSQGFVSGNFNVRRSIAFSPVATDRVRVRPTSWLYYVPRITEIEAWGASPVVTPKNVALASTGTVATASSALGAGFPVSSVINNERAGKLWSDGGGWADGTVGVSPDALELDFNAKRTIDQVVVYTLQDNFTAPIEPTDTTTFTQYGITDFDVLGFDGNGWITLGQVRGNNLVKVKVSFAPTALWAVKINVLTPSYYVSRITEVQAWEDAPSVPGTCYNTPASVQDFTLAAMGSFNTLYLASGAVGAAPLGAIPPQYGSELIQVAQTTGSPANGTYEITISPCRGVIDPAAGACYRLFNNSGSIGTLEWSGGTIPGGYPACPVDTSKTNYVNFRYTYTSCGFGTCDYAIGVNPGYLPPP